jgi:superfamily II RNA helicase
MNDQDRGHVWEESIIHTPSNVQMLALSATVQNADEIAKWMEQIHPERKTALINVPSEERHSGHS